VDEFKPLGQGHAHAMLTLGRIHDVRKEHEQAVAWYIKGAEAGLPAGAYTRPLFSST
jgi:TPR repeat protein